MRSEQTLSSAEATLGGAEGGKQQVIANDRFRRRRSSIERATQGTNHQRKREQTWRISLAGKHIANLLLLKNPRCCQVFKKKKFLL